MGTINSEHIEGIFSCINRRKTLVGLYMYIFSVILCDEMCIISIIFITHSKFNLILAGLWCLTIFQLYRGGKLNWWRKPEHPEKTTDL
jgi:hypothetical protein